MGLRDDGLQETTDYETTDYETTDYETTDYETTDYETTDYETTDYGLRDHLARGRAPFVSLPILKARFWHPSGMQTDRPRRTGGRSPAATPERHTGYPLPTLHGLVLEFGHSGTGSVNP